MLYIVATPIGNLGDITLRALEVFREVEIILCEDTRTTAKLLAGHGIRTPLRSLHQHSSAEKVAAIVRQLAGGVRMAVVTDAGTPGISDPGSALVTAAHEAGLEVVALPGPSAVTAALSVSGFPADRFMFYGFVPKKGRERFLAELARNPYTAVLFESPHRIAKTLHEISAVMPERRLCVCRELTKKFESIYRGTASELAQADIPAKGEFVIVVAPERTRY